MANTIILLIYSLIPFSLIVCQLSDQARCNNDLDCPDTICCDKNKCVENEVCQWKKITTYAVVAAVGFFFILMTFIYMICTIKATKLNVSKIKNQVHQEEQHSHRYVLH